MIAFAVLIVLGMMWYGRAVYSEPDVDVSTIKPDAKPFRFEDYNSKEGAAKQAENAKKALLALHPLGTPVQPLLETLKKAGAECRDEILSSPDNNKLNTVNRFFCRYDHPSSSIFGYTITTKNWMIDIAWDHHLIRSIEITIAATGP